VARPSRFAESTIATRLRAVTSCYRFREWRDHLEYRLVA
jgi:hypothetical protein